MVKIYRFRDNTTLEAWCDDRTTDVGVVDWTLTLPDGKCFNGSTNFGMSIETDVMEIPYFTLCYPKIARQHYFWVAKVLRRWWSIFKKGGEK